MKNSYRQQLTAADLMATEVVTVMPTTSLRDAAHRLVENHISGLPVVDQHNRCLGVISASDIMRFVDGHNSQATAQRPARISKFFDEHAHRWEYLDLDTFFSDDLVATEVAEVMSRNPLSVEPWSSVSEVARLMHDHQVHRVLVLGEGDYLKGVVSALDIVRLVAAAECEPAFAGA